MINSENNLAELTILIVEDNHVNSLMLENMLAKTGFNTLIAVNGIEAIDIYKLNSHIDLIFMDCQMPVMNGFNACREIRDIEKMTKRHIPIIALTANAFEKDYESCFAAGMDDFISKPFKIKQLLNKISHWTKIKTEEKDNSLAHSFDNQFDKEVLDPDILMGLMAMDEDNSKQFVAQISANFFTYAEKLMFQIDNGFTEKSTEQITICANQLKTSSLNVAARPLSELFGLLEKAAIQDDLKLCEQLWKKVAVEFQKVTIAFKNHHKN